MGNERVGCVGVDDARFGERPVAFVVAHHEHPLDAAALVDAVRAHCAQRLGRFKRPDDIRVIETLPRSPTGKLLRRRLRDLLSPPPQDTSA